MSIENSNNIDDSNKLISKISKDTIPFKGVWKVYAPAHSGKFYESQEVDNKIIRMGPIEDGLVLMLDSDPDPKLDNGVKGYKLLKEAVEEARKYGIRFPKFDVVFGQKSKDKNPVAFLIVEKIEGSKFFGLVDLSKSPVPTEELLTEIIEYCQLVSRYIQEHFRSPYHLQDIGLHQLVWGNVVGQEEKHLYNVDIEIGNLINTAESEKRDLKSKTDTNLFIARFELRRMIGHIEALEKRWGVSLKVAKQAIIETYKTITQGKEPKGDMFYYPLRNDKFPEDS